MYKLSKNIIFTKIENRYYISFRNNKEKNVIVINESGKMIINELVKASSLEKFRNSIFKMFGITDDAIKSDIMPFIFELEEHEIIIQDEGTYNEKH